MKQTTLTDDARIAAENLYDFTTGLVTPTVRLGVTGLARSGKTVFITALVHNLIRGGRLPMFTAYAEGRLSGAQLTHQPDDNVARFEYERHANDLITNRIWPQSTRQISQMRLTLSYELASYLNRRLGSGKLNIDIVDYPGEWLLDLPLLTRNYATWSREAVELAGRPGRDLLAADWLSLAGRHGADQPADEVAAGQLAVAFTDYLRSCREDRHALSTLPPGRFLMPGDLEGSPALTFAPLPDLPDGNLAANTIGGLMERRYNAYRNHVVRPFYRDHFARLDRQVVLVDALQALNAGPAALVDLQNALVDVLRSFRPGRKSWLGRIVSRRIDRILFAATKADHLHHEGHERLQQVLACLVDQAMERARFAGAHVETLAIAAVRATREAKLKQKGEHLAAIVGTPLPGERLNGEAYDGDTEVALFPGDLPADPTHLFDQVGRGLVPPVDDPANDLRFLRFRPPQIERTDQGLALSLPHIRLDRAVEFLIGDKLA